MSYKFIASHFSVFFAGSISRTVTRPSRPKWRVQQRERQAQRPIALVPVKGESGIFLAESAESVELKSSFFSGARMCACYRFKFQTLSRLFSSICPGLFLACLFQLTKTNCPFRVLFAHFGPLVPGQVEMKGLRNRRGPSCTPNSP